MTSPFSRREFLQRSALLAAATTAGTAAAADPAPAAAVKKGSANDRLRVAVIGVRGRGDSHVDGFAGNTKLNTVITTVCDCDSGVIGKAMDKITKKQGEAPKFVQDFRKVIDDPNIDIVSIATPNHTHALIATWAVRAGKDVYVEKPVSHNVREGRMIVEAARKHNKIVQTGTQSRSMAGMRAAIEFIHAGKIGKVDLAYATCYKRRKSIGKTDGPQPLPKTIDYDLWCGPAPKLDLRRKNLHYDWHWTWAYGNGDLGNQGIHEMDKGRWGLKAAALPKSVVSLGGRFGYVDDGETANTQLCLFEFDHAHMIFEVRGLESVNPFPHGVAKSTKKDENYVGNIWWGTDGVVVCPSYSSGVAFDKDGKKLAEFKGGSEEGHFGNFVKAVRSRKSSDLNADILEGHLSSAMCHLGNISYRLGAEQTMDKPTDALTGCKPAAEALERMKAHLVENKVDLATAVGRVGPKLTLDPAAERFTAGEQLAKANEMLFREYRKGFDIAERA